MAPLPDAAVTDDLETDRHEEVLAFWFGLEKARHWRRDPESDAQIANRFGRLWEERQNSGIENFLASPGKALAAVILFDQFPRNMFRDDPRAFATDPLARRIAAAALDRAHDRAVPSERRNFLYMPFQHSEDLADQLRSVALFEALGDAELLGHARSHRDTIARFGRFPHRNLLLGRVSTEEEHASGKDAPW